MADQLSGQHRPQDLRSTQAPPPRSGGESPKNPDLIQIISSSLVQEHLGIPQVDAERVSGES